MSLSLFRGAIGVTVGTGLFGVSGDAVDGTVVAAVVAVAGVDVVDVRADVLEFSDEGRLLEKDYSNISFIS